MVKLNENAVAYMKKRSFRHVLLSVETITS